MDGKTAIGAIGEDIYPVGYGCERYLDAVAQLDTCEAVRIVPQTPADDLAIEINLADPHMFDPAVLGLVGAVAVKERLLDISGIERLDDTSAVPVSVAPEVAEAASGLFVSGLHLGTVTEQADAIAALGHHLPSRGLVRWVRISPHTKNDVRTVLRDLFP